MNCLTTAADMRLRFFDGIFVNPSVPGDYTVAIEAISIDPDTGNFPDNQGFPVSIYQREVIVTVPEPTAFLSSIASLLTLLGIRRLRRR